MIKTPVRLNQEGCIEDADGQPMQIWPYTNEGLAQCHELIEIINIHGELVEIGRKLVALIFDPEPKNYTFISLARRARDVLEELDQCTT